jgi:hypothetical protein
MALTQGQQTEVRFVEETTDGTTPSNPTLNLFSTQTQRVSMSVNKEVLDGTDLGRLDVEDWIHESEDDEVEVEFLMQRPNDVQKFVERESDDTTRSFTIEVIFNADQGTSYYVRAKGMRPQTVEVNGGVDSAYRVTVTFVGETIDKPTSTDPGVGTGSRESYSSVTDNVKTFAGAEVQLGSATWAAIVNNFQLTIDHQTQLEHTTGQQGPAEVTHGNRLIEGSSDLAFEDGGKSLFTDTDDENEKTINIPWGASTGDPQWDLTTAIFPSWEPEMTAGDNHLLAGRDFQAQSITFTTL